MNLAGWLVSWAAAIMLAALPASDSFRLNSYGFGSGGQADAGSNNYKYNVLAGETGGKQGSSNYKTRAGEVYQKEANVPVVTMANEGSWYNRLRLYLDTQGNPSGTKFAVAISMDNFTTTEYVKSDFTIGTTLTSSDYLDCAGWGVAACGGAGFITVRGLYANTIYTAKAKAIHGKYTESPYGPKSAAATTETPSLTFDVDVSATDQATDPPYILDIGNLLPGSVTDSPERVWVTFDTNADNGGNVYVSSQNVGLKSDAVSYMINSMDGDLSAAQEGYGAQGKSVAQTSGGPLALASPFDGSGAMVGATDDVFREIFTAGSQIAGGRGSFILKAKSAALTPSSYDYTDILTCVAAASF